MNFPRYLLYGSGQLGMMLLARFFFTWILRFAQKGGLGVTSEMSATSAGVGGLAGADWAVKAPLLVSAAVAGWVLFGFRIFDGVTDPLAGAVSDGWVRRGRQRRTLLWFSFIFPPLGLALVFLPDLSFSPTMRWVCIAGGMFVFFLGYTFYAIPYWSLIDDYSAGDLKKRSILSNVLGAGLLFATAVGVMTGLVIDANGWFTAAFAFAIPCMLLMILPYFAQPKEIKRRPPPKPGHEEPGMFEAFATAFRHRRFIAILCIFSGSQMSFTVVTSAATYIVEMLLGGTKGDIIYVLGPFLGTAIPFFVAVPAIERRFGWQKSIVAAGLLLGLVYVLSAFLGSSLIYSKFFTAGLLFALGGPMAAILLGVEGIAVTACAEQTGGEVTSIYFGVLNFVVKAMNGLAIALTGVLATQAEGDWGIAAVRFMSILAGLLLAVGVAGYFLLRPGDDEPKTTAATTPGTA